MLGMMVVISIIGLVLAIGTPSFVALLKYQQSKGTVQIVAGILSEARSKAIEEKNNFIVLFNLQSNEITVLDDDGGGSGDPSAVDFYRENRGNGRVDVGERVYGPYRLPSGQVIGLIAGTVAGEGSYLTTPESLPGAQPQIVFLPNGSTNEEGIIIVMPESELFEKSRDADQMMILERSSGSVVVKRTSNE